MLTLPNGKVTLNKTEFAKVIGVSLETINRYKAAGKLPFHKIGERVVFTLSDVQTFLESTAIPIANPATNREKLALARAAQGVA